MRTLAIECATEACSVALLENDAVLASFHEVLGRGHAEHLVPMIARLPDRGRADHILVSLGPGSFTGVRIGIAAARALGVAWCVPVFGYPTLALVAAMALAEADGEPVTVCMTGGHGEWFVQGFAADGMPSGPIESVAPDRVRGGPNRRVAGSQAAAFADRVPGAQVIGPHLPNAAKVALLGPALIKDLVAPIYGREPDAQVSA